jgi:TonB family protein
MGMTWGAVGIFGPLVLSLIGAGAICSMVVARTRDPAIPLARLMAQHLAAWVALAAALFIGLMIYDMYQPPRPLVIIPAEQSFYPEAAQRLEIEGDATVECDVVDEKRLEACRVISENPPGHGFGEAAVRRLTAPNAGIDPKLFKGKATYQTRVRFKLAD